MAQKFLHRKTLTDGATITIDVAKGYESYEVELGGDRVLEISNAAGKEVGILTVFQDDTGERTLEFDGVLIPLRPEAGSTTILQFINTSRGIKFISDAGSTLGTGNVTPDAPDMDADDEANTIAFSHDLGESEIEVSIDDGSYEAYDGPYDVGNVSRAEGYYKARIKAAEGRNVSAITGSPAFTGDPYGDELLGNSSFGDSSVWTTYSSEASWTIAGGQATRNGGGTDILIQYVNLETGKTYRLAVDFDAATHSSAELGIQHGGGTFTMVDGLDGYVSGAARKDYPIREFTVGSNMTYELWLWGKNSGPLILNSVSLKEVL